MFTSFIRTVLIYLLVFGVLRLMGKRQISDMQPFDLVITLLIADVASVPISDTAIPLLFGAVPILTLFILHRLLAHFSLKSVGVRKLICGKPVLISAEGVVDEEAMRAANYTLGDLTEQLRLKDVFSISGAKYCILETNGSLSVIPADQKGEEAPSLLIVCDGKPMTDALSDAEISVGSLEKRLRTECGIDLSECFYADYLPDGSVKLQTKLKKSSNKPMVHTLNGVKK